MNFEIVFSNVKNKNPICVFLQNIVALNYEKTTILTYSPETLPHHQNPLENVTQVPSRTRNLILLILNLFVYIIPVFNIKDPECFTDLDIPQKSKSYIEYSSFINRTFSGYQVT